MSIFLQWILPFLILIASLITTIVLTPTQPTQVITPILVGVIMFTLKSFLGMPDVILRMPTAEMEHYRAGYWCEPRTTGVNQATNKIVFCTL